MHIENDFWLTKVKRVPSPFYNERPEHTEIDLLVIHNISLPPGQYGGDEIEDFFTGKLDKNAHPFFAVIDQMQVSAHCLVRRDGSIIQFVPFNKRAWHAGRSSFAGKVECNDYSIGIELEGTDYEAYTQAQYQALTSLSIAIMQRFPAITPQRITGHQYIAPQRKTDPGLTFNWRYYRACLSRSSN